MKRLTKRELSENNGKQIVLCNHKEEDCNDSCMHRRCRWNEKALRKLKEYEDLEEQRLLLRLPVPEGAVVYTLSYIYECKFDYDCKEFDAYKCEEDIPCKHQYKVYRVKETKFQKQLLAMLGETVFLTKEEAEQALAKMKEV